MGIHLFLARVQMLITASCPGVGILSVMGSLNGFELSTGNTFDQCRMYLIDKYWLMVGF